MVENNQTTCSAERKAGRKTRYYFNLFLQKCQVLAYMHKKHALFILPLVIRPIKKQSPRLQAALIYIYIQSPKAGVPQDQINHFS